MTQEQIHQINIRHIKNVDKFYRMFGGLSSNLLYYKYNTLYLKIKVSGRWGKDPVTTCRQIARSWQTGNEELKDAIHYKIYYTFLSTGNETGGAINISKDKDTLEARIDNMIKKIKESEPEETTPNLIIKGKVSDDFVIRIKPYKQSNN